MADDEKSPYRRQIWDAGFLSCHQHNDSAHMLKADTFNDGQS